jgi:hypothetical protein
VIDKITDIIRERLNDDPYGGFGFGLSFMIIFMTILILAFLILFGNFVLEFLRILTA